MGTLIDSIKPRLSSFIFCEHVVFDQNTPSLKKTVSGLFDRINSTAVPCKFEKFIIFLRFFSGLGKHKLRIMLYGPDGTQLIHPVEQEMEMASLETSVDVIFQCKDVVFKEFGTHKARVYVDETPIGEYPLFVKKIDG
jgi:hypothetical protein